MNEKEEMSIYELADMLCASISAKMEIVIQHDEVTVSGGTALDIMDLYIVIKALEAVAGRCLSMVKNESAMKEVLKNMIDLMDLMDFTNEAEHKEDTHAAK